MIAVIFRSSIILLAAAVFAALLRRQSAAVRHAVLTTGLLAALLAPLISRVLPSWDSELVSTISREINPSPTPQPDATAGSITTVVEVTASRAKTVRLTDVLWWIWLAGVGFATVRMMAGLLLLRRVAFTSAIVSSTRLKTVSSQVASTLRLRRPIRLLQNNRTLGLGAFGIFRCSVFLPAEADTWTDEKLKVVLTHELAHIRRHDWLVQMIAESARAIYWFNPLFWLACRRLRRESEHACDDIVLNLGIDGKTYASHLLELARTLNRSTRTWSPILAMAQPPDLERRFVSMLNPTLNHKPITLKTALAVAAAAICLALPVAALKAATPQPEHLVTVATPPETLHTVESPVLTASSAVAKKMKSEHTMPQTSQAFGVVSGIAIDATGAVIPGVEITLSNLDLQSHLIVLTDETGAFSFPQLAPANYRLDAALPGFKTYSTPITVAAGNTFRRSIMLQISDTAEEVTIQAPGKPATMSSASATPRRIRQGGNVAAANLISKVQPQYPQAAIDAGIEGIVILHGIIAKDGTLEHLSSINQADPSLVEAARAAVMQWRYKPTLLNGEPVEVSTEITLNFKLSGQNQ